MGRIEYKYLVPNSRLDELRKALLPYVELDIYSKMCQSNAYTVRSIYFDSPYLVNYHDKLAGIKKRMKVRIRGYNALDDDSKIFLEIKKKNGPTIDKSRYKSEFKHIDRYVGHFKNGISTTAKNKRSLDAFYYQILRYRLKPVINILYEREAYYYRFNHELRITFDMNLRSALSSNLKKLYDEGPAIPTFHNHFILEVKTSAEHPKWLNQVISKFHLRNEALSKYTLSLDEHSEKVPYLEKTILTHSVYLPGFVQN